MSHFYYDNITKIKICNSLYQNGVSSEEIPGQLGVHRATVYRWLKGIKMKGIHKFVRDYKQAKKGRRRTNKTQGYVKAIVYQVREENKKCCGQKIKYFLEKEHNINIAVSTIYRILGEKYQLSSKWKKYCKRGFVRRGKKPRQVIQADTVDFGKVYAFTAIDTFTKEVSVVFKPTLDAISGRQALKRHLDFYKKIDHLQKDGGSEFKAEWQTYASKKIPSIRTAKPYKKNEQAFIERFNGILRKECMGYLKYKPKDIPRLQKKVDEYLEYYHNKRPHLSLNMKTPKEFSMSHLT